mmetsp:Transcript_6256/g.22229  ORF Transcript_6256/g.22229 Transcript_6256/m.22229 type:complete len:265 (+) Transcript_6256:1563-2357(+)
MQGSHIDVILDIWVDAQLDQSLDRLLPPVSCSEVKRSPPILLPLIHVRSKRDKLANSLGVTVHGGVAQRGTESSARSIILDVSLGVNLSSQRHELRHGLRVPIEGRVMQSRPLVLVALVDIRSERCELGHRISVSVQGSALDGRRVSFLAVLVVDVGSLAHGKGNLLSVSELHGLPQIPLSKVRIEIAAGSCSSSQTEGVEDLVVDDLSLDGSRLLLGVASMEDDLAAALSSTPPCDAEARGVHPHAVLAAFHRHRTEGDAERS